MSPRPKVDESESAALDLQATPEMCHHCFDVLMKELRHSSVDEVAMPVFAVPPSAEAPLFVTWDKRRQSGGHSFDLRGCIGTLTPRPLLTAVGEYALTSAFRDRRFGPIRTQEVPHLRVAVSLLINYEQCDHCHDWSVGVHGIIITFQNAGVEFSATYLPEVAKAQQWDEEMTVRSLIRKSGFHDDIHQELLSTIQCTRYQSSKQRLTYEEYVQLIGKDPLKHEKKRNRFVFF